MARFLGYFYGTLLVLIANLTFTYQCAYSSLAACQSEYEKEVNNIALLSKLEAGSYTGSASDKFLLGERYASLSCLETLCGKESNRQKLQEYYQKTKYWYKEASSFNTVNTFDVWFRLGGIHLYGLYGEQRNYTEGVKSYEHLLGTDKTEIASLKLGYAYEYGCDFEDIISPCLSIERKEEVAKHSSYLEFEKETEEAPTTNLFLKDPILFIENSIRNLMKQLYEGVNLLLEGFISGFTDSKEREKPSCEASLNITTSFNSPTSSADCDKSKALKFYKNSRNLGNRQALWEYERLLSNKTAQEFQGKLNPKKYLTLYSLCEDAIKQDPYALYKLAKLHEEEGEREQAEKYYKMAYMNGLYTVKVNLNKLLCQFREDQQQ